MARGNKRKAEDFDPTKSDSADSTYGASASRSTRSRPTRSQQGKQPARKKQRRKQDDDLSDISHDSLLSDVSSEDHIEEEPELDEQTGRPKRQAAKKRPVYQEESEDDIEDADDLEEAPDPAPQEISTPRKKGGKPRSLVLKLNVSTPQPNPAPAPTKRSTRARSGSAGVIRPNPSASTQIRRSSRIAHDDSDPIVALTDSGHHMDIIRPGTRSPEANITRAKRGGKGIKKLPTSVVYEEEEESAAPQHQTEVAASHEDPDEERDDSQLADKTDVMPKRDPELLHDVPSTEVAVIPESEEDEPVEEGEEEDDDEQPISRLRRTRQSDKKSTEQSLDEAAGQTGDVSARPALRSARATRKTRSSQKNAREESSDFEPGFDEAGEEDISDSEASISSPRKASQQNDEDNSSPGTRGAGKSKSRNQRPVSDDHDSEVAEELAEELQDLRSSRSRTKVTSAILYEDQKPRTREKKRVDYRILRPDVIQPFDEDAPPSATTPSRRTKGGGGWERSLHSVYGPFGGATGPPPVLGGPYGVGAAAGAYSDSSDDDLAPRPRAPGVGGVFGMTPTAAAPAGLGLFPAAAGHGADALQGAAGTPANLGRIKDKSLLADADPLGVDQNVNFDGVGGLQGHIDQLKEMVALPLLYPEIFQRFHVTPPRGVLFHGPPGTGKTLLARALASSVSSQGRKVTFYMRKGADALSKWVGEAEKQLRLLFEEARRTQPSIIFFDEIDGMHNLDDHMRCVSALIVGRACTGTIQQAGADPCFDRLNATCIDGWHGWPRSSHCDWGHQSAGFNRSSTSTSWPIRPRVLFPSPQYGSAQEYSRYSYQGLGSSLGS